MSLPTELMGAFQYRTAMAWQRLDAPEKVKSKFLRDSPAFQIIPELAPQPNEAILDKITMSAFEGTFLEIALRVASAALSLPALHWRSESTQPVAMERTSGSGLSWFVMLADLGTRKQPTTR